MSKGTLGSFSGTATPDVNMLSIFKENELSACPNSTLKFSNMVIRKIGIQTDAGTILEINGKEIPMITGTFELGFGQVDIHSLVFRSAADVSIYYMY